MSLPGIAQFDLTDRLALITGGSKGLGAAMAAGLASAGADLVLVSRHFDEAQALAEEIVEEHGRKAVGCEADITIPEQVEAMVAAVLQEFGHIDILLNSAGINTRGPIEELTLEQFEEVMRVNVTGTWMCCKAIVPHMKGAGWGRIINMLSLIHI